MFKSFSYLVRLEAEGAGAALVGDAAVEADDIQPVGPGGVGELGRVIHAVDQSWDVDLHFADAGVSGGAAFGEILVMRQLDLGLHVILGDPAVQRVRLADIDEEEFRLLFVFLVEFVERGNLPAEGSSGVAAEDQHHRLLTPERGKRDLLRLLLLVFNARLERKVRCRVAHLQVASARQVPQGHYR